MIVAVLLAACLQPPLFATDGVECGPEQQEIECLCSECVDWPEIPGAEWYEIRRQDPDGFIRTVGDTRWRNRDYIPPSIDPVTGLLNPEVPAVVARLWCFAFDTPIPRAGSRYEYRARACKFSNGLPNCGAWGNTVVYAAAPYMVIP